MSRQRVRLIAAAIPFLLVATAITAPQVASAEALPSDACKIEPRNQPQPSVGLPISSDRLAGKARVTVMVVPFEFKDTKFDLPISSLQGRDQGAASTLQTFSRNRVSVQFRYTDTILKHRRTLAEWEEFLRTRNQGWNDRDDATSTYGVVRELLAMIDATEDMTGVDSVIFQSSLTSIQERASNVQVYEAFQTAVGAPDFFRPFQTDEGQILNAIIMTGFSNSRTVAHELLHNFGLVDLYGNPGLEQAEGWSMMSSNEPTLFNWERWQLGWLAEDEIVCIDLRGGKLPNPMRIDLTGMAVSGTKMFAMRTSDNDVSVLELRDPVVNPRGGQVVLAYTVSNSRYPGPIRTANQTFRATEDDLKIGVLRTLGEFEFMTLDVTLGKASIGIWHNSSANTAAVTELRSVADTNLQKRTEAEAQAKLQAVAKAAAAKAALVKKKMIYCVKGKTVKKVTAVSPKCPLGYKKR